jgi:hypothetical protein
MKGKLDEKNNPGKKRKIRNRKKKKSELIATTD